MANEHHRQLEFMHFLKWVKSADRTKPNGFVYPLDSDRPFCAFADENEVHYTWGEKDEDGVVRFVFN